MSPDPVIITAPGVHDGMDEHAYHGDPVPGGSLSASGMKLLLPPSCPARYQYDRMYGQPPKAAFDFGTAAHKLVLGTGPRLVIVDAPDWRTKAAKEAREQAHLDGHVPLLLAEFGEIQAMAAALRAHPIAGALLDPARGKAEQSAFWQDEDTGVWRRCRYDFLPYQHEVRRMVIPDYKTTPSADAESVAKHMANYGYHVQAAQYTDGARALGLDEDPAFLFVFQEKTPPYLVHVAGLDDQAMEHGRELCALACEIWRDCTQSGYWPGYSDTEITYVSLPRWARRPVEDFA